MKIPGWFENKMKGTRAAGVELHLQGDSMGIRYVIAEKKRSKIEITANGHCDSIEELDLPKDIPVCISISGKGIIHKKVASAEEINEADLLNKVLPNAKPEDFYVQHAGYFNNSTVVSAARKDNIDELLDLFTRKKIEVIACTLGPFSITSLLPAMGFPDMIAEELELPGCTLTVTEGNITGYTANNASKDKTITIAGDAIPSSMLVPFASALGYFTGGRIGVNIPSITLQAEEWKQRKIFKASGAALLVFILTILLGNYFAFDHYWKEKRAMESQALVNTDAVKRYEKLKLEYEEKISFLKKAGLTQLSRTSFYTDRIAASVPAAIQLSEINIAPRVRQADENKITFETGAIRVSGSCAHSSDLNEWMKTTRKKEWASEVELIDYKQGKADPAGEFTIGIKIR